MNEINWYWWFHSLLVVLHLMEICISLFQNQVHPLAQYKPNAYALLGLCLSIIIAPLNGGVIGSEDETYWSFLQFLECQLLAACVPHWCVFRLYASKAVAEAYFGLWLEIILGDRKAVSRCVAPFGNTYICFQSTSDIKTVSTLVKNFKPFSLIFQ